MRLVLAALLLAAPLFAQTRAGDLPPNPYPRTPASERLAAGEQRRAMIERSLLTGVEMKSVGPTVMSGRVVDVDVNPDDPTHFYVAYASGGVWRTQTNGQSFEPVFDTLAVMTIGDIAVDWGRGERLWVGTGENNASRSSYAGAGIWVRDDTTSAFRHTGLGETHRTGRIVLHPDDPDVAWVAASGPLYSPSRDRGLYRTTDGGRTWTQTLYVGPDTGGIDLVRAGDGTLYAAMWERTRRAWDFVEAGAGSGIYRSDDDGASWQRVAGAGFPDGEVVGRIGLDVHPDGTLFASVDNQTRRPAEPRTDAPGLTRDSIRAMSRDDFTRLAAKDVDDWLEENGFPASYTAQTILRMIREDEITPLDLVLYLEDANAQLFDTPVVGVEVYRSDDGGASFARTHEGYLDNVVFSYGYYFGEIRVSPLDRDRLYIMGVPILRSDDGGATWKTINGDNVHVDHHALWVSPTRDGHLVNGNDGGVNISYDDGETWTKANLPAVGQFYAVQVDNAEPYNVYGGLQDNGTWMGPSTYRASLNWYEEGRYPFERLGGGDGMQVEVDPRDNATVYTGFQFGFYSRQNTQTGARATVRPRHELGERPLRFNWQTPIHLSRHNPDILYLGSNKLHRSLNQGDDWQALSGDLTTGGLPGDVPFGTLTSIDESPLRFGLLWTGSDDGLVHVSRDAGTTFDRVDGGLPQGLWVSRVEASHHEPSRAYVTLNGYRFDHMDAYLYATDDMGRSWTRLGTDLPAEPLNVVLEDPSSPDLLYVGSDHGLYVSLDRGRSFMPMMGDMPHAPVHDLKIQARERDLLVGTHGRSLYVADVERVQMLTDSLMAAPIHVFAGAQVTRRGNWGETRAVWLEPVTPSVAFHTFAREGGVATVTVADSSGSVVATRKVALRRGLDRFTYDLRADDARAPQIEPAADGARYLPAGTYAVEVRLGGSVAETTLTVRPEPTRNRSANPRSEQEEETELARGRS
jgi:photosystem II stability/assembly factor-like uncharacterized protein